VVFLADQPRPGGRGSPLGCPWIEPVDVTNSLLWLVSEESRYVTGVALPIDQDARTSEPREAVREHRVAAACR
jgi:NAD(P)-dependent dehydrogenase (short-subunit alcohol dehydrogenase family)